MALLTSTFHPLTSVAQQFLIESAPSTGVVYDPPPGGAGFYAGTAANLSATIRSLEALASSSLSSASAEPRAGPRASTKLLSLFAGGSKWNSTKNETTVALDLAVNRGVPAAAAVSTGVSDLLNDVISTNQLPAESESGKLLFLAWLLVSMLLTLSGNILVIVVIVYNSDIHDAYYYFVAAYAISDILTAFAYSPGAIFIMAEEDFAVSQLWCKTQAAALSFSCLTSLHILGAISVERYIFFCHPFPYQKIFSACHSFSIIGFIWIFALLVSLASIYTFEVMPYTDGLYCYFQNHYILEQAVYMPLYLIPTALSTIVGMKKIFSLIIKHKREIRSLSLNPNGQNRNSSFYSEDFQVNLKAFRTAFLLVGIFWVTWFPWAVNHIRLRIIESITMTTQHNDIVSINCDPTGRRDSQACPTKKSDYDMSVRLMTLLILTVATSLNPIIHYCNNSLFRNAFKRFCIQICWKEYNESNEAAENSVTVSVSMRPRINQDAVFV